MKEIDFVIGSKHSLGDRVARIFAASLYRAIGYGHSVQTSFDIAVNAVRLEGFDTAADSVALLHRENADARQTCFAGNAEPTSSGKPSLILDVGHVFDSNEQSPFAAIHFTLTATLRLVKITEVRTRVLWSYNTRRISSHVPAAPVTERALFTRLEAGVEENILPTPHIIHKDESDGFLIKIAGDEGKTYVVQIDITCNALGEYMSQEVIKSEPLLLQFPIRSVDGMLNLLSTTEGIDYV